jgi:hypothetical protein
MTVGLHTLSQNSHILMREQENHLKKKMQMWIEFTLGSWVRTIK